MNRKLTAVIFALCLLLSGCVLRGTGSEDAWAFVYRVSTSSEAIRLVREYIKVGEDDVLTERIIELLNSQPVDIHLLSAFPEDVQIVGMSLEKGLALVKMSPGYADLDERDRLLADAAIVLSLSAVNEVCYVDIACKGKVYGVRLCVEGYAEADGVCGDFERTMKLYLPGAEYSGLVPRSIDITDDSSIDMESRILKELFGVLGDGMENTSILSVSREDSLCMVDLSEEFYGAEPADSYEGMVLIYSIVNSLCRVPGVDSVTISVEGVNVSSYGGYSTTWPMGANMSLVNYG